MNDLIFDIIVIGAGPGGYTAALHAASKGRKVAVIEKDEIGGVCLNKGCIPTKSIIACTELLSQMKRASDFGLSAENISFDWLKILERKDRIVLKLRKGIEFLFKNNGIESIKSKGKVSGKGMVEVEMPDGSKKEFKCGKVIIATGTEPKKFAGFEGAWTTDDIFNLKEIPKTINIIGAGAVGVEFASIFNALGTEVTLIEMMPNILPTEDPDISKELEIILKRKGIKVLTDTKADFQTLGPNPCLLASGRSFTKIEVNELMETKDKDIFAIGDVTGISMYAHTAEMQGIVAAENACGGNMTMDYSVIPSCIFSSPEIASVGLSEKTADKGITVKSGRSNLAGLGKAAALGERDGFVKLTAEAKTGRLLGCHIIGHGATDIIAEMALAIRKGLTAKYVAQTVHAHPTLPEGIWEAARMIK